MKLICILSLLIAAAFAPVARARVCTTCPVIYTWTNSSCEDGSIDVSINANGSQNGTCYGNCTKQQACYNAAIVVLSCSGSVRWGTSQYPQANCANGSTNSLTYTPTDCPDYEVYVAEFFMYADCQGSAFCGGFVTIGCTGCI